MEREGEKDVGAFVALVLGAEDRLCEGESVPEVETTVHVGVREGYHEGGTGAGEERRGKRGCYYMFYRKTGPWRSRAGSLVLGGLCSILCVVSTNLSSALASKT